MNILKVIPQKPNLHKIKNGSNIIKPAVLRNFPSIYFSLIQIDSKKNKNHNIYLND